MNSKHLLKGIVLATLALCACACEPAKPTEVKEARLVGAYDSWKTPDSEALAVFKAATEGTDYAALVPEKFSTQVVAGTNFRFLCGDQIVTIFRPLPGRGEPEITSVKSAR